MHGFDSDYSQFFANSFTHSLSLIHAYTSAGIHWNFVVQFRAGNSQTALFINIGALVALRATNAIERRRQKKSPLWIRGKKDGTLLQHATLTFVVCKAYSTSTVTRASATVLSHTTYDEFGDVGDGLNLSGEWLPDDFKMKSCIANLSLV